MATAKLNGKEPETRTLALGNFLLDLTDATHISVAEAVERGGHISMVVTGTVSETGWKLKRTADGPSLGVTWRVAVSDVTPA